MKRIAICLLLISLVAAVYHGVVDHEFVYYDDQQMIVDNPDVQVPLSLESAIDALRPNFYIWTPLALLSLRVSHAWFGLDPTGYILTNVALHALSAALLFLALLRMTGRLWCSAFVAAVFAVHPLQVEPIAWAVGRKDALAGTFWMLTLYSYARYTERPGSIPRYLMVAFAFLLALLSKATVVPLPMALLLLDYWPLRRLTSAPGQAIPDWTKLWSAFREKLPLLAMAVAASAFTYFQYKGRGHMDTAYGNLLGFDDRLLNAIHAYVGYLHKVFWPSGLAVFYPHPLDSLSLLRVAADAALLGTLTYLAARAAATRPYLLVGWLWFLGMIVPMIGVVNFFEQASADRYTYFALIGLAIAVAWGAAELLGSMRYGKALLAASGIASIAALATAAGVQTSWWKDTPTLLGRALAVTDDNWFAHFGLGGWHVEAGRIDEAQPHYQELFRLRPDWDRPRYQFAQAIEMSGDLERALVEYEEALRVGPRNAEGVGYYGLALVRAGRWAEGLDLLEKALTRYGGSYRLRSAASRAAIRLGDDGAAARHLRAVVAIKPGSDRTANHLAWLLATSASDEVRDPAEAVRLGELIVSRGGRDPNWLDTLAAAYAANGQFEAAVRVAAEAEASAGAKDQQALARQIGGRLELYRSNRPYREPPRATPNAERPR